jgi:hypothetical protein
MPIALESQVTVWAKWKLQYVRLERLGQHRVKDTLSVFVAGQSNVFIGEEGQASTVEVNPADRFRCSSPMRAPSP